MNKYDWHPWFAWYPVFMRGYGKYAWLRWVECRLQQRGAVILDDYWEYRMPVKRAPERREQQE